ncbi:hypothetical protein FUAX_50550 (plasmid) [Fulvitalea axinellae]|uniref:DUF4625 domain-containing protein n=1 Tax=Fulvitalea axinellae TaxID=1182444 RepID=A0AAU9D9K4_9BACT|nr:hypothetical protein FUAX_50550 [Fulvitalea axinellae]
MKKTILYFLIFAGITAQSCSSDSDDDSTKPVISDVVASDITETVEGETLQVLHTGEAINLKAKFTDNEGLASYKVDIHFAEGHDHSHSVAQNTGSLRMASVEDPYKLNKIVQISGTVHNLDWKKDKIEVVIPAEVKHGEYHLIISVLDESGNSAEHISQILIEEEGEDHDH